MRSDTEESNNDLDDSTEMNGNLVKAHNDILSNNISTVSNLAIKGQ